MKNINVRNNAWDHYGGRLRPQSRNRLGKKREAPAIHTIDQVDLPCLRGLAAQAPIRKVGGRSKLVIGPVIEQQAPSSAADREKHCQTHTLKTFFEVNIGL